MKKSILSILLSVVMVVGVGCGHKQQTTNQQNKTVNETKTTVKEVKTPSIKRDDLCDNISKYIDEGNVNDFSAILNNPSSKNEYLLFGYIDKIEVGKDGYQYISMHTINYVNVLKEIYNYISARIEDFSDGDQHIHKYVVKYKNNSNRVVKGKYVSLGTIGKFESFSSDDVPVFKTDEVFNGDLVDGISGIKSIYSKDNQPKLIRIETLGQTEILKNANDKKLYFLEVPQCGLEYNGYDDNNEHMLRALYYCHIFELNKIPEKDNTGYYIFNNTNVSNEYNIPITELKSELVNTQFTKDMHDFYQFNMPQNKK